MSAFCVTLVAQAAIAAGNMIRARNCSTRSSLRVDEGACTNAQMVPDVGCAGHAGLDAIMPEVEV